MTGACGCPPGASPPFPLWRLGAGVLIAVNGMVLSLAINDPAAGAEDTGAVRAVLLVLAAASLGLLGAPLFRMAASGLRQRRITVELLFVTGIAGAMGASLLSHAAGSGPTYYDVPAILAAVYAAGRHILDGARGRAAGILESSLPDAETCEAADGDGIWRTVGARSVRAGEIVRVHPGRTVPADGVIQAGSAFVRQGHLTGEGFAVSKKPGDFVTAGSQVADATILIRAAADGGLQRIDALEELIERARQNPGPAQSLAERVAAWLVPVVWGAAGLTFAGWWHHGAPREALFNALSVLLVACPCALGFATPAAVWAALVRIGQTGIALRGGAAVEALAGVRAVLFDKTGTLTNPETGEARIEVLPGSPLSEGQAAAALAAAEAASDHPVARAIRGLACDAGPLPEVLSVRVLPGAGIEAMLGEAPGQPARRVRIGLLPWLGPSAGGGHAIGMEADGVPAARLTLTEAIHPGIGRAVEDLRSLGVRTVLLTGDAPGRAQAIPIPERRSRLTPEQKLAFVRDEQRRGNAVLFAGDGLNDAAAMAAAEVSLAPEGSCPAALAVASGVWCGGSPEAVAEAIRICRETAGLIRGNIRIALAYNAIGIVLAAGGLLHPVAAAALMTASSLTVTWRALRWLEPASGAVEARR